MLDKEIELLEKSIDTTEKVVEGYESNDFLDAIQGSLKATQAVLKSLVDVVEDINKKVNTGTQPEQLMKSLNSEVSEVFGTIEKALTTLADRVEMLERSPSERRSALMKSEALERFGKILDERFGGSQNPNGLLLKSAGKPKVVSILMKGVETGQLKATAVTRFETGGVASLHKPEVEYVENALKA
jgi:uncharacterized protein YoxC